MLNQRLYLIGMPGSGKSAEGKKLAAQLDWTFIDLDKAIEQRLGESISSIFEKYGEPFFRHEERYQLEQTASLNKTIIACGGGTACFGSNMDFILEHGKSIYLKANPAFLLSRLEGKSNKRPLFKGLQGLDLHHKINDLLQSREPYFNRANAYLDLPMQNTKALYSKALNLINER